MVLSTVLDIYWGSWKVSPMGKGGLLYSVFSKVGSFTHGSYLLCPISFSLLETIFFRQKGLYTAIICPLYPPLLYILPLCVPAGWAEDALTLGKAQTPAICISEHSRPQRLQTKQQDRLIRLSADKWGPREVTHGCPVTSQWVQGAAGPGCRTQV